MDTPAIADFPDDLGRLAELRRRRAAAAAAGGSRPNHSPDAGLTRLGGAEYRDARGRRKAGAGLGYDAGVGSRPDLEGPWTPSR